MWEAREADSLERDAARAELQAFCGNEGAALELGRALPEGPRLDARSGHGRGGARRLGRLHWSRRRARRRPDGGGARSRALTSSWGQPDEGAALDRPSVQAPSAFRRGRRGFCEARCDARVPTSGFARWRRRRAKRARPSPKPKRGPSSSKPIVRLGNRRECERTRHATRSNAGRSSRSRCHRRCARDSGSPVRRAARAFGRASLRPRSTLPPSTRLRPQGCTALLRTLRRLASERDRETLLEVITDGAGALVRSRTRLRAARRRGGDDSSQPRSAVAEEELGTSTGCLQPLDRGERY